MSWALSQRDLSLLLGQRSRGSMTALEFGNRLPNLRVVLACQMLFDSDCEELFPELFSNYEDDLLRRAAELDRRIARRHDAAANRIRELLESLADRLGNRSRA